MNGPISNRSLKKMNWKNEQKLKKKIGGFEYNDPVSDFVLSGKKSNGKKYDLSKINDKQNIKICQGGLCTPK